MKKYHNDIYIPNEYIETTTRLLNNMDLNRLYISNHLKEHINNNDKKHTYTLKDVVYALKRAVNKKIKPFEITTTDYDFIEKFCVRVELDNINDICISINPYKNMLITAWINEKNDNHKTLKNNVYEKN